MKKASLIAAIIAGAAISASPAIAKTSISKSYQICEEAAEKQDPAPKSVRADRSRATSGSTTVTVPLKVKNADDSSATLVCKVDRETGTPTLTSAS